MAHYKLNKNKVYTRKKLLVKKLKCNSKLVRVHKQTIWKFFDNIKWKKYWMFFDNDSSHIEIMEPTLDNLTMMKEYKYILVVKGFKSMMEYKDWDRIRFKQGFYSMMYASRCLDPNFMADTITKMLNKEPMPNAEETKNAFEGNRFVIVENAAIEKRILERDKYRRLFNKYTFIMKTGLKILNMNGRIEIMS